MANGNPWSALQFIAERRIEEAQSRGAFDNLPGQGRPLELEDMSHVPEDLRMAYKILRNAGYLPPELAERKELNRLVDLLGQCEDEQERVRQMQKLQFMVVRTRITTGCWTGYAPLAGPKNCVANSSRVHASLPRALQIKTDPTTRNLSIIPVTSCLTPFSPVQLSCPPPRCILPPACIK